MIWSLFIGSTLIIALAYWSQSSPTRSIHRTRAKLRPAPRTLPLIGNALHFLRPRHVLFDWFVQCQGEFGLESFSISIPSLPPGIVISDPKALEYVLKNESTITKGEFFRRRSWDLFGHGIINSDGDLWKTQRKAGLKFFAGSNLDILVEKVLPTSYRRTRSILECHAASGEPLDLEAVFLDLTTAVVGRMAYDMDMDASTPFSRAFDYASDQTGRRFQNPLYRLTEIFTSAKFRSSLHQVKCFGQYIVSNAQRRRKERKGEVKTSDLGFGKLIDSLMDAFDEDPVLTADAALNFLSAGRDTTAQSLTWTFYSLFRHSSSLAALRREIDPIVPRQEVSHSSDTPLTAVDLQPSNLPHTMSIFNESLRLYPPVPFEIKQCQVDTTLPDGTFLPSGSIIVWCIWAMNRAKEIWGDDAASFKPARWLQSRTEESSQHTKVELMSRSAFEFPVFNGGPRSCLGKKMAELIACWVLVNIWHDFDFEEVMDRNGRPPAVRRSKNSLTLPMEGGLPCRVKMRRE